MYQRLFKRLHLLFTLDNCIAIIAMSCFLFDGIFVGLTRAKDMRNSMLLSASVGFFGVFWVFISGKIMGYGWL